jgi:hypothetical protein
MPRRELNSAVVSPHHPWWEPQYRHESMDDIRSLLAENELLRAELAEARLAIDRRREADEQPTPTPW